MRCAASAAIIIATLSGRFAWLEGHDSAHLSKGGPSRTRAPDHAGPADRLLS